MAIGILTLVAAAVAFGMAVYISSELRRCRPWPTTPGKILERGVGEPMATAGRSYLPRVKYAYTVAGKEYTNDQVYLIRRTGGLADSMQKLVDSLPDPVPVHYDPQDPSQSYLLVNPMLTFFILVAFGVGATLIGLMHLLTAFMKPLA